MESTTGDHRPNEDVELGIDSEKKAVEEVEFHVNFSKRAQWLRAAVLGANDGLLSTASLMMGVGAVRTDPKSMILSGIAGLIAGACSMAIGELVSVYSQYDIELAQINRDVCAGRTGPEQVADLKSNLPGPWQAAGASALSFAVGALVPLLAALFIKSYLIRLEAVVAAVSVALLVFGWLSATLGKAPVMKSLLRVLAGGWVAMAITFGFTKLSTTGGEIWSNIVLDVHDEPTYGKGDAGEAVDMAESPDSEVEFSVRAQWIRAAVLGANDGMVSTAALMMGVGAVNTDIKSMIVAGLAGLFAGACSMAIGELVSVYSQYDIELAQIKRCIQAGTSKREEAAKMKKKLPCPWKAAIASFLSFVVGALVPLLAAVFFKSYVLRVGMVVAAVSVALLEFGWLSAKLGKAPVVKSSVRVLVGGWLAMGITFGFTKLVGSLV